MENYSLADISAVTGKDTNVLGGGGSGLWVFALLILLLIGGDRKSVGRERVC